MFALLLLGLIVGTTGHAQSFDCEKAKSPSEKTICGSQELKSLDSKLAAAYKAGLAKSDDKAQIRQDQRQWLKKTAKCKTDVGCLKTAYDNRLRALGEGLAAAKPEPKTDKDFSFSYKSFDCHKGKASSHISVPIFAGTDKARVKEANAFIQKTFEPNAKRCSDEDSNWTESVDVVVNQVTKRAFTLTSEFEYSGGAYPSGGVTPYIVIGAKPLDVGNGISPASYTKLLKQLIKNAIARAKKEEQADPNSAEACTGAYEDVSDLTDHSFAYSKGNFILSIYLAHVMQACNAELAVPKEVFLREYVEKGPVHEALSSL